MKYSLSCLVQWHDKSESWFERILAIDHESGEIACLKISTDLKAEPVSRPFWRTIEEIELALADERARIIEKDPFFRPPVNPSELTEAQRKEWELICKALQPVVNDPRHRILRMGKSSRGLVATAAKAAGVTRRTVYRLLQKYWKGGQTPQCFLPNYEKGHGKSRSFKGGQKRGKRSRMEIEAGHKIGIIIKPERGKIIFDSLKRNFVGEHTFQDAYERMLFELYCDGGEVRDRIWVPTLRAREEIPTRRQAEFLYKKFSDPEHEATVQQGKQSFILKGRAITGNTESRLAGPGEVGQMDSTTADIYLVSEHDPNLIVGRPVAYGMKDAWGRFLYSVTATFERPSYWSGAIALENALVDKVEYCAQLGITIPPREWLVDFLPAKALVDRGDMSTYKTDHLVTGLGLEIDTLPAGRGDLKGIIEQHFRLSNNQMIRWLPGALPRFREDRSKRYEFDAILTISEFRRLLVKAVLCYHRAFLPVEYKLAPDMIAAGVNARPIELLEWGMANRPCLFRRFPLDQARFHLLPHDQAAVTEKGVRIRGVYYTCNRAVVEKWFERARRHGIWHFEIAFDPRTADRTYFQIAKGSAIETLDLTPDDRRFHGWTWEEIDEHFEHQRSIRSSGKHEELQDKFELIATAKGLSEAARVRQKEADAANPHKSKAKQLRNIPKNRAAEKARERADSLNTSTDPTPMPTPEAVPDNVVQLPGLKPAGSTVPVIIESAFTKKLREKIKLHQSGGGKNE